MGSQSQELNLQAYFAQYPGFSYDPAQPATSEFRRLCHSLGDGGVAGLRQGFADALGNQFGQKYGVEMEDLSAWQRLCRHIGIEAIPEDLDSAQEAVRTTYFNIIDLIDVEADGRVPTFSTKKTLKEYSFAEKKLFPRQCSTAGAILASLLPDVPPTPNSVESGGNPVDALTAAFTSVTLAPIVESASDRDNAESSQPDEVPVLGAASVSTTQGQASEEEPTPLNIFFFAFPGFTYDSSKSATSEFWRLCRHMRWKRKGTEKEEAYRDFSEAMAHEFGRKYGVDMDDLGAWQRICQRLGLDPIPDDLEEAREMIFNTYVNLVDLVDNGEVCTFDTELELSEYSKKTGKIFPAHRAYGEILVSLLRYIRAPPPVGSRRNSVGILIRN